MTDLGWLDAIEARLRKLDSPAPWRFRLYCGWWQALSADGDVVHSDQYADCDAEFIAHAPADIALLLAAVRERDAALARVEALCLERERAESEGWRRLVTDINGNSIPPMVTTADVRAALAGEGA